jgi:hypothetical protein
MKLKFSFCSMMVIALLTLSLFGIKRTDIHAANLRTVSDVIQVSSLPFNGWLDFDDYADYAKAINTTELNLPSAANGDFTIEASFQISKTINSILGTYDVPIIRKNNGYGVSLGRKCSTTFPFTCEWGIYRRSGGFGLWIPYSGYFLAEQWYHIALVNDGAAEQTRLYFDGALIDSSSGVYSVGVAGDLLLGCLSESCSGDGNLLLAMDEIRISDIARYTTSFVTTTLPFVCDGHTRALWHFDELEGSTVFHDSCGTEDNLFTGYNGAHTEGVTVFKVYLPLTIKSGSSGISGKVSYNGSGVGNLALNLMEYDGASSSRNMTTTTQADGTYMFSGANSLSAGQFYYVRYWNSPSGGNTSDSRYLVSWISRYITSTEGTNVAGVDFDIADVVMQSPASGSSLPLPVSFQWVPRGITGDNYLWSLMNASTSTDLCWGPLQTNGNFTLDLAGLNACSLSYGVQYGWYVYVIAGNNWGSGYGKSYYYSNITFTASAVHYDRLKPEVEQRYQEVEPIYSYLK